ncbi:Canalicular multispecific organic anion transporter 1 [Homalodisca vitripennis]|nr:Canalicular multispecific organic anion transporter 1 [Homalodisca vitripennis]
MSISDMGSISCALMVVILVDCLADFVYAVVINSGGQRVYSVDFYSPAIKFISFCLVTTLMWFNKKRGQRSSGLIFLFWFIYSLCGVVQLRTMLRQTLQHNALPDPMFLSISYLVFYIATVLSLLLNCFAEPEPKFSEYPKVERLCPEKASSFPSKLTFNWFSALAWKGYKTPLEPNHLWHMNFEDTAQEVVPKFDKYWDALVLKKSNAGPKASYMKRSGSVDFVGNSTGLQRSRNRPASILMPLCKAFGGTFLFGSFLKLIQDLLTFVSPQILKLLIGFTSSQDSMWKGYFYAVLLAATATCQTLLLSQYFYRMSLVGLRIRTALISSIYRKVSLNNKMSKHSNIKQNETDVKCIFKTGVSNLLI